MLFREGVSDSTMQLLDWIKVFREAEHVTGKFRAWLPKRRRVSLMLTVQVVT